MKNNAVLLITSLVLLTALPHSAAASGSMRCGTHIVSAGQRNGPEKYEILKKCGEPDVRGVFNWTYTLPSGATRVLIFDHNGNLSRVESGSASR